LTLASTALFPSAAPFLLIGGLITTLACLLPTHRPQRGLPPPPPSVLPRREEAASNIEQRIYHEPSVAAIEHRIHHEPPATAVEVESMARNAKMPTRKTKRSAMDDRALPRKGRKDERAQAVLRQAASQAEPMSTQLFSAQPGLPPRTAPQAALPQRPELSRPEVRSIIGQEQEVLAHAAFQAAPRSTPFPSAPKPETILPPRTRPQTALPQRPAAPPPLPASPPPLPALSPEEIKRAQHEIARPEPTSERRTPAGMRPAPSGARPASPVEAKETEKKRGTSSRATIMAQMAKEKNKRG
jgi:hypothetical protein